jgi:hypothetical protein
MSCRSAKRERPLAAARALQSTESGAQFSDLGEGVTYQFRLRANREGLSSSWTTSETVTTLEPAPVAPNAPSLVIGEVGIGTVELRWERRSGCRIL